MRATLIAAPMAAQSPRASKPRGAPKTPAKQVYGDISEEAGVRVKDTKAVLDAIRQIAIRELRRTGTFKLPALVSLRSLHKAASPAKVKSMFGKDVLIAAKPARMMVKATVLQQLRDALAAG